MIKFIVGFLVGGLLGVVTMILCQAAKIADEEMIKVPENMEQNKKHNN